MREKSQLEQERMASEADVVQVTTRTREGGAEETMVLEQQVQMPPVLKEKKKWKVLVAIDESEESFYALKWALDNLFLGCTGSEPTPPRDHLGQGEELGFLTILHVHQAFGNIIFPAGPVVYATSPSLASVKKAQEENSAILFSKALQICKERPVKAETLILEGDPKEMICEAVEKIRPDVLVVGSRGLSKLKRAFLGSVSDYCAHHAKCPILIVKPPK